MSDLGGDSKFETAICYLLSDDISKKYKISVFHNKTSDGVMKSASNVGRIDVINVSVKTKSIFCDQDGDKRPTILLPRKLTNTFMSLSDIYVIRKQMIRPNLPMISILYGRSHNTYTYYTSKKR